MGGNVAVMSSGSVIRAQKIPLKEIGRSKFEAKVKDFLKDFNKKFEAKYKQKIWVSETDIISGVVFNGSTSFIMDPTIKDDVASYKPTVGDIDLAVPEELKSKIWNFLKDSEGKEFSKDVIYIGNNKPTIKSIGEQINAIFKIKFDVGSVYCQFDFEFLQFVSDHPSEWAKFGHSSSWDDAKSNIKAVHHKYLLRALIGAAKVRPDIVIATPASTPDNFKLSKSKANDIPRMLKFSVTKGVRVAYEPLLKDGEPIFVDGKQVYKEIKSSESNYIDSVAGIFEITFGKVNDADLKQFRSFVGVVDLVKKYFNQKQIDATVKRYVDLLWGTKPQRAQELEVQNPDLDFQVKNSGYQYLAKKLRLKPINKSIIDDYYKDYGHRKSVLESSFKEFLNDHVL